MAGARGGRGSTTVCLVKNPTVHFFFHLSVTYYGTALQVEIGPLLLG